MDILKSEKKLYIVSCYIEVPLNKYTIDVANYYICLKIFFIITLGNMVYKSTSADTEMNNKKFFYEIFVR